MGLVFFFFLLCLKLLLLLIIICSAWCRIQSLLNANQFFLKTMKVPCLFCFRVFFVFFFFVSDALMSFTHLFIFQC